MNHRIPALLLLATLAGTAQAQEPSPNTGNIRVVVNNIRNASGFIGVALFEAKDGFPDKPEHAITGKRIPAGDHSEIIFENVPYGTYAVSVLHDENGNGRMDKNFIGIPKEGFGTSNNPKIRRGPPSFSESSFSLESHELAMKIDMNYY